MDEDTKRLAEAIVQKRKRINDAALDEEKRKRDAEEESKENRRKVEAKWRIESVPLFNQATEQVSGLLSGGGIAFRVTNSRDSQQTCDIGLSLDGRTDRRHLSVSIMGTGEFRLQSSEPLFLETLPGEPTPDQIAETLVRFAGNVFPPD